MNEHPNNPMHADDDGLPPELRAISDAMDQLAASDRRAAGAAFEHRLAASTRPGLPLESADVAHVDSLAHADRRAASATLEDRIFVATRALLNRPAEVATDEAPVAATIRIHTRSFRWAARAAAVLALGAGATLVYLANQTPTTPVNHTGNNSSGTEIASDLESDFQDLGKILSVALGGSETDTASSSSTESTTLESNELELPRLDFLNTEVEGSI